MANGLLNLMKKEILEMIRDPKILLGVVLMPLIIFPTMGLLIGIGTAAVVESTRETSLAIMDLDHGIMAENLILTLKYLNFTIIEVQATSLEEVLNSIKENDVTALVIVPEGFSDNLTLGIRAELIAYSIIRSTSMAEGAKASVASIPINIYETMYIREFISEAFPEKDPNIILDPISLENYVVFKGNIVRIPPEFLQGIFMSQSIGFPMVIMLLIISAMQIAASSVSIEKEQKTLETLLTLPIGRLSILTAKLVGSAVVAAAGAFAAMIGVGNYTGSIFSIIPAESVNLEALGFTLSPIAYALLGLTMFMTIISALSLAICVASFSEDVRSAQSLVGPLNLLAVFPSIILMFADIEILPVSVQTLLYILPYTHAIVASKAAFMGDYLVMLRSIAYIGAFTFVILYIAAEIFKTEKIITSQISFRKRRC